MNDLSAPMAARVNGIKASIKLARDLMQGRDIKDLESDVVGKAAFERSLQDHQ
jgi:hypothetical protein